MHFLSLSSYFSLIIFANNLWKKRSAMKESFICIYFCVNFSNSIMVPPKNLSKKFVFSICRKFFMMNIFRVSDPDPYWIRIQSAQWIRIRTCIRDPDLDPGGNYPQKQKKLWNFMFWSAGCSLLRAKGFFCNLEVLYGCLGIGKL